jgi:uncharacterized protein (TIGR03437 family)
MRLPKCQVLALLLLSFPCSLLADYGDTFNFTYQIGGSFPTPQYQDIISTTPGRETAGNIVRTSGQPWLQAYISSSTTPFTLTVGVNPTGLTAGSYFGTVQLSCSNCSHTLDFNVNLTVTNPPPPLTASPSSLTFTAIQGSATPPSQTLIVGGNLTTGSMITSSSTPPSWLKAGWISVGNAPMSIPLSINDYGLGVINLTPGTYTTSLVFEAPFTSQKITVPITLIVTAPPPVLKTNLNQLQFQYVLGGSVPSTQAMQVTSSNSSPLTATVSLSVPWLTANALTGTTPFTTNIGVNPNGLAIGTYNGTVTVATSLGAASTSSQSINVTLTVAADTRPAITSVINGASFKPVISPGAWISIMGKNFSTTTQQATSAWLGTSLNGVSVQLSGPGGIYSLLVHYVSPTQINAFVPHEVSPLLFGSTAGAQLMVTGATGTVSATVDCEAIAPALFSYGVNNTAAAVFPDGTIVGTIPGTRGASPGSIISLYGTGFGQTLPKSANVNGPVEVRPLVVEATVAISGVSAKVLWAGMVGIGLYQLNIEVPSSLAPGDYPLVVKISGAQTEAVQIPIR